MLKKRLQAFIKESARDFLALGSIAFLILVIARALVRPHLDIVYQLIVSSIILLILGLFVKKFEYHLALGLVLVVFTIFFYDFLPYDIFAIIVYILMIFSALYLKIEKIQVIKGVILGIIATTLGYYLTKPIIDLITFFI